MNSLLTFTVHAADLLWSPALEVAGKSTIILIMAILLSGVLQRRRPLACSAMWNATLLGLVVLPIAVVAGVRLPVWTMQPNEIGNRSSVAARSESVVAQENAPTAQPRDIVVGSSPQFTSPDPFTSFPNDASPTSSRQFNLPIRAIVIVTLGLGMLLATSRLAAAMLAVNRLQRTAQPVRDAAWTKSLSRWVDRLNIRRRVSIKHSTHVTVPLVVGAIHPTILVPSSLLEQSQQADIDAILAHELAHVRRDDYAWQLLLRFLQAAYWYHPLIWLAEYLIAANRERACDEFAVYAVGSSNQYAETLLAIAGRIIRRPIVSLGIAVARTPRIAARLKIIESSHGNRHCRLRNPTASLFLIVGALLTCAVGTAGIGENKARAENATAPPADTDASKSTGNRQFDLHVVDAAGKPVHHATIEIRTKPSPTRDQVRRGDFVGATPYGANAFANDDGELLLELPAQPKQFVVKIEEPGYGPYWAAWDSEPHPEEMPEKFVAQLDAGWSVGGAVVDDAGKPIKGVAIHPFLKFKKRPGDTQELYVGTELTTDIGGKWSFRSVPDSLQQIPIEINHPDFKPDHRALTRAGFGIANGQDPAGKIVLQRGLTVAGRVTDESGNPVAGALVRTKFMNDIRKATTGTDGTYRLAGCEPRMARIVVSAKGRALDLKDVQIEPNMEPVNFTLKPGGKIRVRVLDSDERPIAKARIFFQLWRGQSQYFEFDHVNQYANDEGVWEWNEAPLDEFKADICPPGGMELDAQPLIARNAEYVFHTPAALVISGTVVDAKTQEPIKAFRVIPGIRSLDSHIDWARDESYTGTDGQYRIKNTRGYPAHLVRIEADGYDPAVSEDIKSNAGKLTVNFQLKQGVNIAANVLTPDGLPAAGARVVLGAANSQINIENGEINDGLTYAPRRTADASGRFQFPPQNSAFRLIIVHPSGYASINSGNQWTQASITLTPWARVEGTFRVGKQPVANAGVTLQENGLSSYGDGVPHIFTDHNVTTGPNGRFVFERVIPGDNHIGRQILLTVTDGASEALSSKQMPLKCKPSETTHVNLGGDGRELIGTLVPPAGFNQKVLWNFAMVNLQVRLPQLNPPPAPAAVQNNPQQYQAWWNEWQLTKDGQAWRAISEANQRLRSTSPYFYATVDRDGHFQIDDVPPGEYSLSVRFDQHAAGRLPDHPIPVPAIDADKSEQPLDLGVLQLE